MGNGTQPGTRTSASPMSALGQKRTCAVQNGMSALPPKADIDEPVDSITASTTDSGPGGTVRPRLFAVFRLMMNSNLVVCTMGNYAGSSPSRDPSDLDAGQAIVVDLAIHWLDSRPSCWRPLRMLSPIPKILAWRRRSRPPLQTIFDNGWLAPGNS